MALYLSLSTDQLAELQRCIASNDADLPLERLRIIELSAQGKGVPEISRAVGIHAINVRKWLHRYQAHGVDGLRSGKSPGRPPLWDDAMRAEIAKLWKTNPRTMGLTFSRWSLERMRRHLRDTGTIESISVETIRQCINAYA